MNLIPLEQYREILKVLPILCVDIMAQNSKGEYLLIKRANEPKKDVWWVIGGRVLKGETLLQAAMRKVREETGLKPSHMRLVGCFELVDGVNPFGLPFEYHTVSAVFSAVIDETQPVHLDKQSLEYKFSKELPSDFYVQDFQSR